MNYCRTDVLSIPEGLKKQAIVQEAKYYGINILEIVQPRPPLGKIGDCLGISYRSLGLNCRINIAAVDQFVRESIKRIIIDCLTIRRVCASVVGETVEGEDFREATFDDSAAIAVLLKTHGFELRTSTSYAEKITYSYAFLRDMFYKAAE